VSKAVAVALNILSFVVMLGLPLWIVTEKFPVQKSEGGILAALGFGGIVMGVIVFFTFKKYIVAYATDKLGAISAGVTLTFIWAALTAVCVALAKSATLLDNLTSVFLWSTIGAAAGVVLQTVAKILKERAKDGETD
jgi:hypothetical protein